MGSLDSWELVLKRYLSRGQGASSLRTEIFDEVKISFTRDAQKIGKGGPQKIFTQACSTQAWPTQGMPAALVMHHDLRRQQQHTRPFVVVDVSLKLTLPQLPRRDGLSYATAPSTIDPLPHLKGRSHRAHLGSQGGLHDCARCARNATSGLVCRKGTQVDDARRSVAANHHLQREPP